MTGIDLTYDNIIEQLENGIVRLSFIKVKDGQVRNMRATLKEDYIPHSDHFPDKRKHLQDKKEVVRVYDLDVEGWRSFRVNSLQTFDTI